MLSTCVQNAAMEGANTGGEVDVVKLDLQRKVRSKDLSIKLIELTGKSQILLKFRRVECSGVNTQYAACKTCLVVIKFTKNSGLNQPKRKVPSHVKSHLTNKIACMCTKDLRAFATVEEKGFIKGRY
ncbi:hypothetical protein ATANTOWER_031536 [Ataeniobius toweri]|uniref:60S ribosomal protein L34 n=1 Tax=Ataeniobius toweri TaxID=208326 RepID=A0ABU7B0S6_9TELE|nr:hypothetical protein [Ataeniobius toweri]